MEPVWFIYILVLGVCLALMGFLAVKVRRLHNALGAQSLQTVSAERAEARMHAMMDAMSRAVLLLTADGDLVWANATAVKLFNFARNHPPYPDIRFCFNEHTSAVIIGLLRAGPAEVAHSGRLLPDVPAGSFATAGGVPLSLNLDHLPTPVSDGQYMLIAQDISASVRRKVAFEQTERYQRALLDTPGFAMAYCNEQHKVLAASQRFSQIYGDSSEEVVGQPVSRFFRESNLRVILAAFAEVYASKGAVVVALDGAEQADHAGAHRSIKVKISWSANPTGFCLLWLSESVTNHGDASLVNVVGEREPIGDLATVVEERNRLRYALDNLQVGVWEYQIPENRLIWDDQMYKLYDLKRADFKADFDAWSSALLPEDFKVATKLVADCIEYKKPFKATFRVKHRDGAIRMLSADAVTIYDALGQPRCMIGTNVDITDKHTLEQAHQKALAEARALALQRAAFMATMSHELRTPLNGVLGMLEMLLQSRLSIEQVNKVQIAQKSAESLLGLLHDVLEISTLNAGQVVLTEQPFNLRRLIGDFAQSVAFAVEEKGLTLVLDTADLTHADVIGDADRIRQVLTNLVGNAKKFTRTGEIILRCSSMLQSHNKEKEKEKENSTVRFKVSVIDTGVGISTEALDKVFDPFYQADSSSTREYGGAGLGLSICKNLCELMGGTVAVESTAGQGAVFSMTVSLRVDADGASSGAELLPRRQGWRVLLILENAAVRLAVRRQLEQWGAVVSEAGSGEQSRQVLHAVDTWHSRAMQPSYDVVLVNRHLPDFSGPELVSQLRQWGLPPTSPILFCGPMAELQDVRVLAEWGVAGYLSTPIAPIMLEQALAQVMGGAPMQRAGALADSGRQDAGAQADTPQFSQFNPLCPSQTGNTESDGAPQAPWLESLEWRSDLQVLVVEDNEVNQEIVLLFLQEIGLEATVANNGKEALTCLQAAAEAGKPIQVIFMDCQMPEMDGYDATRAIREGRAGNQYKMIPIIALTANALSGDREKCLAAGMDDYLSKPVAVEDFYARLAHWSGLMCDAPSSATPAQSSQPVEQPMSALMAANETPSMEHRFQEALSRVELEHLVIWDKAAAVEAVGSEDILAQLVRVFCDRKNERLQKILFNFSHQDYDALAVSMHSLKGSADQLMGSQLAECAASVKTAALAHDQVSCEQLRTDFIRSFERLETAFEQFLSDYDHLPVHPQIPFPQRADDSGSVGDAGPQADFPRADGSVRGAAE